MTEQRTDAEWRAVAEGLPGWAEIEERNIMTRLPARPLGDVRVRGLITDHCEWAGWLHAVKCRPNEPNSYTALFLLPDGRMSTTPMHRAPGAVHALILAAEARNRADPARGWF